MNDEAINLLRSIDASMKQLVAAANRRAAANGPTAADDRDLDSQWGDEEIKFVPRDWVGESFKGRRMSECPPDLLDMLAQTFDYFAAKNDKSGAVDGKGKPKSFYDKRSAARARGWAARLRAGWKPKAAPASSASFDDADDIASERVAAFEGGNEFGGGDDF